MVEAVTSQNKDCADQDDVLAVLRFDKPIAEPEHFGNTKDSRRNNLFNRVESEE
jgi:hypothetical protein